MSGIIFEFPKQAAFGRIVAKDKIYYHSSASTKIKRKFIDEVDRIIWSYKLSPETVNLPAKYGVNEIQVFTILFKNEEYSTEILEAIDKAIPSPIIFQLKYKGKVSTMASYKRQSEADKSKWVFSSHFGSQEFIDHSKVKKMKLPVAIDMSTLYHKLLIQLLPIPSRENESIQDLINRYETVRSKEREALKLETKVKREQQFNRKVDLNRSLNQLREEIEEYKC